MTSCVQARHATLLGATVQVSIADSSGSGGGGGGGGGVCVGARVVIGHAR